MTWVVTIFRFVSKQEKERREKIERENEILLRKILDCHHGVDRSEERQICVYCMLHVSPQRENQRNSWFCWQAQRHNESSSTAAKCSPVWRWPENGYVWCCAVEIIIKHVLYSDSGKLSPIKQKRTSRQINTKRQKQKTDYENLLLLQKIQNVKPSNSVRNAFG